MSADTVKSESEYAGYSVQRLDEFNAPPRTAVVQGAGLDEGGVAAVVGPPNAGKTALAVDLGLHISAHSERWLGLKVRGGPIVYCAAEAPGSVRLRAAAARRRKFPERAAVAFYIVAVAPGLGGESSSAIDASSLVLTIERVASIEGECVRAVFIDTLASCLGDGDENGDGMIRLVNAAKFIAQKTGACVILVHHPSKGDATGLRGHGSLAAACDSILRIELDTLTGVRTVTLVKARDCATGMQLRYELEPVVLDEPDSFGDPLTTIIVRPAAAATPSSPRPSGQRQQQLLVELERRHRTGETSWDEATVRKAGRDLGMTDQSARDAVRGLQKGRFVVGSPANLSLKYAPESTGGTK